MDAALQAELTLLASKARFVREVIGKEIMLLGIKNAELEAVLEEREYPRIDGGYGYLTRMPVSTLTAERASELDRDADLKGLQLEGLRATPEREMWLKELDELEKHFAETR